MKKLLLIDMLQSAISAHQLTSFDPEKRGWQIIECYSGELEQDLEYLSEKSTNNNYESKYREKIGK